VKYSKDNPPKLDVKFFIKYIHTNDDPLFKATFDLCNIYCGNEKLILEFPKRYALMTDMIKLMLDDYSFDLQAGFDDNFFELRFK
jgi:hypothetical protein